MAERGLAVWVRYGAMVLAAAGCGSDPQQQGPMVVAGMGVTAGAPPVAGTSTPAAGAAGAAKPPTAGTTSSGGAGAAAGSGGSPSGGAGTTPAAGGSGGNGGAAAVGGGAGGMPAGGAAGMAMAGMGAPPAGGKILPPVDGTDKDGPFKVTVDQRGGANSWIFHPTELGKDGLKHPIFVWGTGATSVPMQYMDHFTRMASHGFVIISPNTGSVNAGALKASLDWLLMQNTTDGSKFFGKLDPMRIAMGGHSLGSVSTFNQEQNEMRLVTTIHIAGGSMDGQGSNKVKTPTAYICGETDIALSNCQRDFMAVKTQPTFFSVLTGVDHVQCARQALPGMIAWLRWHLAGETERKAQFTGPDGDFFKGIWKSQTKNW